MAAGTHNFSMCLLMEWTRNKGVGVSHQLGLLSCKKQNVTLVYLR